MSSVFSGLFAQHAELWRCNGINESGDIAYTPALTEPGEMIAARVDITPRTEIDREGSHAQGAAEMCTIMQIKPLDKIRYGGQMWTVKAVSPACDISGRLDHYEAVLG